jgi:hypothetical protein
MRTYILIVFLSSGTVALCPLLPAAPAPKPSLEEEVAPIMSIPGKTCKSWIGNPVKLEKPIVSLDEEFRSVTPAFQFVKGTAGIVAVVKGKDEFLKKQGVKGLLVLTRTTDKGSSASGFSYYRFEEKDRKRYLVISDKEGGEIAFSYEITGKTLKLKGGKVDGFFGIGSDKLAGEYTLQVTPFGDD